MFDKCDMVYKVHIADGLGRIGDVSAADSLLSELGEAVAWSRSGLECNVKSCRDLAAKIIEALTKIGLDKMTPGQKAAYYEPARKGMRRLNKAAIVS